MPESFSVMRKIKRLACVSRSEKRTIVAYKLVVVMHTCVQSVISFIGPSVISFIGPMLPVKLSCVRFTTHARG